MARLADQDTPAAWFHRSFAVDPWSTAIDLLNLRDELLVNGSNSSTPATPASGSSLSGGEATPWVTLRSLAEICDDVDTVIWWGCQDDGQARSRLWSPLTAPPSERKKTVLAPDCRWGRSCRHWPSRPATPINGLPATV